jgi:hypothetical protein
MSAIQGPPKGRYKHHDWKAVVPGDVAKMQRSWERVECLKRMRHFGFKFREISEYFGISDGLVMAISQKDHPIKSPVERYFNVNIDVFILSGKR